MKLELNADEARVLKNLLNVACKATGLEGAESCIHFAKKIEDAVSAAEKELECAGSPPSS